MCTNVEYLKNRVQRRVRTFNNSKIEFKNYLVTHELQ